MTDAPKPRRKRTEKGRAERRDKSIPKTRPEFSGERDRDTVILLRRAGMTQQEIAKAVGVSDTAVGAWENGKQRISQPCVILLNQLKARFVFDEADLPPSHFTPIKK